MQKQQVQRALMQIFHLSKIPRPDDAADAIAIAYAGHFCGRKSSNGIFRCLFVSCLFSTISPNFFFFFLLWNELLCS